MTPYRRLWQSAMMAFFSLSLMGMHCGSCPDLPTSGNMASGDFLRGNIVLDSEATGRIELPITGIECKLWFSENALLIDETSQPIETQLEIDCETDEWPEYFQRLRVNIALPDLRFLDAGDTDEGVSMDISPTCSSGRRCASSSFSWTGQNIGDADNDPSGPSLWLAFTDKRGTEAPYPDNVTEDFIREVQLTAHFPERQGPAADIAITFVQRAADYRRGWEYSSLTDCSYDGRVNP